MYRDKVATERFGQLVSEFKPVTLIETGTDRGLGAIFFSRYVPLVVTIEINPASWHISRESVRAAGYIETTPFSFNRGANKIILENGNSPDVLGRWLQRKDIGPIFIFLDAHWNDYWPLLDELRVVHESGVVPAAIIVHDMKVPGKPFLFPTYNGQALDLDYVREPILKINPNYTLELNQEAKMLPKQNPVGILYAYEKILTAQ